MNELNLKSIENSLLQVKPSNARLNDKMHELYCNNSKDYEQLKAWYDKDTPTVNIFGKMRFEHEMMENFKKSVYGDNYEIKPFR